ncbi:MAG: hypothetical protein LBT40_09425 [Deltaproteobacteria bacterium]|nr:hypothetical protein [Deltaproteobacteria bacterium]
MTGIPEYRGLANRDVRPLKNTPSASSANDDGRFVVSVEEFRQGINLSGGGGSGGIPRGVASGAAGQSPLRGEPYVPKAWLRAQNGNGMSEEERVAKLRKIRESAQEYEGLLMAEMIKQMRQKPMAKTPGSETLSEIAEKPFTAALTAAGGLGLADKIVEDVAAQEGLAATLADHPEVMGPNWRQRIAPSRLYKPVNLGGSEGGGEAETVPSPAADTARGGSGSGPATDAATASAQFSTSATPRFGTLRRAPDIRTGSGGSGLADPSGSRDVYGAQPPSRTQSPSGSAPAAPEKARAGSTGASDSGLVSLLPPPSSSAPAAPETARAGSTGASDSGPVSLLPPPRHVPGTFGRHMAAPGTLSASASVASPGAQEAAKSSRSVPGGARPAFRRGPGAPPVPASRDFRTSAHEATVARADTRTPSPSPSPASGDIVMDEDLISVEDLAPAGSGRTGQADPGRTAQANVPGTPGGNASPNAPEPVLTGREAATAWAQMAFRPERASRRTVSGEATPGISPASFPPDPAVQKAAGAPADPGAASGQADLRTPADSGTPVTDASSYDGPF